MGEVSSLEKGVRLSPPGPLHPDVQGTPEMRGEMDSEWQVLPPWLLYRIYRLLRGNQKEREHSLQEEGLLSVVPDLP